MIYQLITGEHLFQDISGYIIYQKINEFKKIEYPEDFNKQAQDLIDKLLMIDPKERLGSKSYKELKEHVFFSGIDFDDLQNITPPFQPFKEEKTIEVDVKQIFDNEKFVFESKVRLLKELREIEMDLFITENKVYVIENGGMKSSYDYKKFSKFKIEDGNTFKIEDLVFFLFLNKFSFVVDENKVEELKKVLNNLYF
jgi:serine/threonine protein kinase